MSLLAVEGASEVHTLHVFKTPDTCDTVTDALTQHITQLHRNPKAIHALHSLRTRPVSSTFAPTEVPAMRDSRIEETSDAAACDVSRVRERQRQSALGMRKRIHVVRRGKDSRELASTHRPLLSHMSEKQQGYCGRRS